MLHIVLHGLVPTLAAVAFFRPRARQAALVMIATMAVDVDHLLADPIYDPERCSIGFHPLHTTPAIWVFGIAFVALHLLARQSSAYRDATAWRVGRLVCLGLLIHMALDGLDCFV